MQDASTGKLTIFAILHDLLIKFHSLHTSVSRDLPIPRRTEVLVTVLLASTSRHRFRTNWYTFTILFNKVEITSTSATPKGVHTIHNPQPRNHSFPHVLPDPRICDQHSRRRQAFCDGTIATRQLQLRYTQEGKPLTLRPLRHSWPSELLAFHLSKSSSVHCRVCNGAKSRKIMACLPSDPESFREAVPRSRNL